MEFWSQTFYETDLLTQRWRLQQARADRRAAFAALIDLELNRDRERRPEPFSLEEVVGWLGHGFHRAAPVQQTPAPAPTAEELLERAKLLNQVYGGTTYNGTG